MALPLSCVSEVFREDGRTYGRRPRVAATELAKIAATTSMIAKKSTATITGNSIPRGSVQTQRKECALKSDSSWGGGCLAPDPTVKSK